MQRHHRDRDLLWLTSGLPFLAWASETEARTDGPPTRGGPPCPAQISFGREEPPRLRLRL